MKVGFPVESDNINSPFSSQKLAVGTSIVPTHTHTDIIKSFMDIIKVSLKMSCPFPKNNMWFTYYIYFHIRIKIVSHTHTHTDIRAEYIRNWEPLLCRK